MVEKMKILNLGCGTNTIKEAINVDKVYYRGVNVEMDLESFPWPWADDSVDKIIMDHSLEHIGQVFSVFLKVIQEMYRVSKNGTQWEINVPHWRHDNFSHDPTHVRIITPITLMMFCQDRNYQDYIKNGKETKLGLIHGVDIQIVKVTPGWQNQHSNPPAEIKMELIVFKPQRYPNFKF